MAAATHRDLRALGHRVGNVFLDLLHRRHIDERPDSDALAKPVAHLEVAHCLRQFLDKCFVNPVLRENTVDANASLAGVTIF